MAADDNGIDIQQMRHQSTLLKWQKMYETALHSDRVAADLGIFVMKILLVINGGALIAVMNAVQPLGQNKQIAGQMTDGGGMFLWALAAAALAAGVAYFYQGCITSLEWNKMHVEFGGGTPAKRMSIAANVLIYAIIIPLCLLSFGLFLCGGLRVLWALEKLAALPVAS